MAWVNLSEYGRQRGCSSVAVKKAITSGRLKKGARQKPNGKYEVNPDIANIEWELNTKIVTPSAVAPAKKKESVTDTEPEKPTALHVARTTYEEIRAKKAKLDFEEKSGKLVSAEEVKGEWSKIIVATKTKILSIPSKAKSNIPELTTLQIEILDRLVREALEDLANGSY